jgi:hypothetical protein
MFKNFLSTKGIQPILTPASLIGEKALGKLRERVSVYWYLQGRELTPHFKK